jgi:hypothetical protein
MLTLTAIFTSFTNRSYKRGGVCLQRGTDWIFKANPFQSQASCAVLWLRFSVAGWPVPTDSRVRFQVGRCEISGGQWHWDRFFFLVIPFSSVHIIQPIAPHFTSSTCCSYSKDKRAKHVNFPQNSALSGNGRAMDRNSRLFLVTSNV